MVGWSAANVRMLAMKLAAVCFQRCLMINLRMTGSALAKGLACFKYAQQRRLENARKSTFSPTHNGPDSVSLLKK